MKIVIETDDYLTPTQARRLNLHLKGYSMREIGRIEGVSGQMIGRSVQAAKKRIKNIKILK